MEVNPETGARYSQPLESSPPPQNPPVVRAGFVNGVAGFIFRGEDGEVKRVVADKSNVAVERPRGLFSALARLFGGQR